MTQDQFNDLPQLLTRSEVVAIGIPEEALRDLKHEIKPGETTVPPGKIGWVAFDGARQGKYRKSDVAALMGLRTR